MNETTQATTEKMDVTGGHLVGKVKEFVPEGTFVGRGSGLAMLDKKGENTMGSYIVNTFRLLDRE